jgi:polyphosphate:AMP phosphotransferase
MFEPAEIEHAIDKHTYEKEVAKLRAELLDAQYAMLEAKNEALAIVIAGVDGAGKGETVNLLNSWLDPRHVRTYGIGEPSDEERERPPMWRYWRLLPPKGKTAVFVGSWYTQPIIDRVYGRIRRSELDGAMEQIRAFERMLYDERVVLLKLWFHLAKDVQRKRLKSLAKDPRTRWRVTDTDWDHFEHYDTFREVSARALRSTSTEYGPWIVVPGAEPRYRALSVGRALLDALCNETMDARREPAVHPVPPLDGRNILQTLDLGRTLDRADYERQLEEQQGRLATLVRHRRFRKRSLVAVFEGVDAAGKGGAIRRVTAALDARVVTVVPIAAPTDEERVQPYLWRFWRHLPRHGHVVLFDRSWYGRVLVERVEGFCGNADWMRAYAEINQLEEQLVESGIVLVKLWLQIDRDEQARRFTDRQNATHKRYKIGPDDWRNRDRWKDYEIAASDMIERTGTEIAPWTLVEANDKHFARIKVLRTLCERLEDEI